MPIPIWAEIIWGAVEVVEFVLDAIEKASEDV